MIQNHLTCQQAAAYIEASGRLGIPASFLSVAAQVHPSGGPPMGLFVVAQDKDHIIAVVCGDWDGDTAAFRRAMIGTATAWVQMEREDRNATYADLMSPERLRQFIQRLIGAGIKMQATKNMAPMAEA